MSKKLFSRKKLVEDGIEFLQDLYLDEDLHYEINFGAMGFSLVTISESGVKINLEELEIFPENINKQGKDAIIKMFEDLTILSLCSEVSNMVELGV